MKLTQFTNPFSGQKGSIADIGDIWSMILGVVVLFFVFATGQSLAKKASTASNGLVDTTVQPIITQPQTQNASAPSIALL